MTGDTPLVKRIKPLQAKLMSEERHKPTREERLAAKLRENLRRRKQQARALTAESEDGEDTLPKAPEGG